MGESFDLLRAKAGDRRTGTRSMFFVDGLVDGRHDAESAVQSFLAEAGAAGDCCDRCGAVPRSRTCRSWMPMVARDAGSGGRRSCIRGWCRCSYRDTSGIIIIDCRNRIRSGGIAGAVQGTEPLAGLKRRLRGVDDDEHRADKAAYP